MARVKKAVYTSRVRVKDFLCDFDRLRTGVVHENHFISGLSIAGLDKTLSPQHIGTILDAYRVQTTPSLSMIDWVSFVEDVERIFTTKARAAPRHRARCAERSPAWPPSRPSGGRGPVAPLPGPWSCNGVAQTRAAQRVATLHLT